MINEITDDLLNSKEVARNKLALPLLLILQGQNQTNIEKQDLLNEQDSVLRENIFDSFMLNHYNKNNSIQKITEFLKNIDDGAKAQLISKLKYFLKANPNLIEIIPVLLNYTNELVRTESVKFIRYAATNPAIFAAHYINNPFPETILEQLIEAGKIGSEHLQKDLLSIIFPIDIPKTSKFCTEKLEADKINFSIEEFSFDSALYLIRIMNCGELQKTFIPNIKKHSLNEIYLNTTALNMSGSIKEKYLKQLLDNLKSIKSKYSAKEYTSFVSLILNSASKISNVALKNKMTALAIEGLNLNLEPNALQQVFNKNTTNPAIDYLQSNFKTSEIHLSKLLTKKSPSILKKALASIPKDNESKVNFRKQTILNLRKLLDHQSIENRRSAYLALKTQSSRSLKTLWPTKEMTEIGKLSAPGIFYLSRLALEDKIDLKKKDKKTAREYFIKSLNLIDCRERTSLYTFLKHDLSVDMPTENLESKNKFTNEQMDEIANSQITCLTEPREIRARAIKNLSNLKPFSEQINLDLSNQISNLINSKSSSFVTSKSLDLLSNDEKTNLIVPVLKVGVLSTHTDNSLSTLRWLTKNNTYIKEVESELKNQINSANPKVGLMSALLLYSLNQNADYLNNIRHRFFSNLEQTIDIFDIDITDLEIANLKQTGLNESNSTYGLFLNYLFCVYKNDSESCEKVVLPLVLLNDKPFYVIHLLTQLTAQEGSENIHLEKLTREIVLNFVQTGHYKELTTLNKNPKMIKIFNELRKSTTSISDSKSLDFLLQY